MNFLYLLAIVSQLSVVVGGKCGYVRGPLAATNDTVIIDWDCWKSTPMSSFIPLQLPDSTTHVTVKLVHCHTVPVGLFTNITDNLTSVTVASDDVDQLLEGTFKGLEQVTELRLLGFARLENLSISLLDPLRNIQTLILDGFGSKNIQLPYLGSVIQKLSGTPIRRLVLHKIKDQKFFQQIMKMNDYMIPNASVKELIITDAPLNYEGSIRWAFPNLVCFCGEGAFDEHTETTLPAVYDLMFLHDEIKELIVYRPEARPAVHTFHTVSVETFLSSINRMERLYPGLLGYILNRKMQENCSMNLILKFGANLSRITVRGLSIWMRAVKPICVEEDNNLVHFDFTGSHFPGTVPVFVGLKRLQYASVENTGIQKLPGNLLQYLPSLKVLKLSRNDIGDFIENLDGHFFGSCPTLADIQLHSCNITNVPMSIFSYSVNLQRLDMSNNYLHTLDFDLQNCTRLSALNFSRNDIGSIAEKRIGQLTQLALQKRGGNELNLVVDLSHNLMHCLCNSTHFVKWLQRSPAVTNITFHWFDSYACLYPNGSSVRVSKVNASELEQQCSVIQTLVNGSDCPCDKEQRSRLQQVWVHLEGFVCKNGEGVLAPMAIWPFPSCFNPYMRASFIAPVVVGGLFGVAVLITVGLFIYYRNTRPVREVRDCLEMFPARFVHAAIDYVMRQNHEEENAMFHYDMIIFVQDDDRGRIHNHFIEALQGYRRLVTRDDFCPGVAEMEAMAESISVCRWIVPVFTANFISDPVCVDFVNRAEFSRPHALIPVVWEQPLDEIDVSVAELLRIGDPLYWPGDQADVEDIRNFWSSLLDRAKPL